MLKNKDNDSILKIHFLFHYLVKIPYLINVVLPVLPYLPIRILKYFCIYNQLNDLRFHKLSKYILLENFKLKMGN